MERFDIHAHRLNFDWPNPARAENFKKFLQKNRKILRNIALSLTRREANPSNLE